MLKNIKYVLIAAFATLAAVSCQDYLNTPPVGSLSPDGFYNTPAHVESGVLGVYSKLQGIEDYQYILCSEDRSDNVWVNSNPDGTRVCSEVSFMRSSAATAEYGSLWAGWYSLIYNANTVLANIDAVEFGSEAVKNQFKGELLFLRGLAHFELARTFGNVPIVDRILSSSESKELAQSPAATVIGERVIPDLKEAETLLPYRSAMVDAGGSSIASDGRADKLATQALLARVYMTLKGFPFNDSSAKASAQSYLSTVLSNGASYFAPTISEWKKQWMTDNSISNKYQIFAIQHRLGTGMQITFTSGTMIKNLTYVTDGYHSGSEMYPVFPEATLRYEYVSYDDPRGLGWSFIDGYAAYEGGVTEYPTTWTDFMYHDASISSVENAINCKWCPTIPKRAEVGIAFDESQLGTSTGSYNKWPVNFPILRYEDMMLLQAELYAEDGNVAEALKLVNQIRNRAGIEPRNTGVTKEQAMNYIKRERQLELYLEGVRWFDQVRYGEWKETTLAKWDNYKIGGQYRDNISTSAIKDGRHFSPIPTSEMSAIPGLYNQNPGWE